MSGRWIALVAYTLALWLLALVAPLGLSMVPMEWSSSDGSIPIEAVLQNLFYVLGPAMVTAALAMTVTTIAVAVARTKRPTPVPQEPEDPWEQDAVLLTR
ncbi:hypothetical protein NB037_11915 [Rathayibacter sp. ZW T2_19]|uniref:Uncharacterized protein n=1 Tax=Rathayibacter rubneri TaxID=2950106 RepID=A0A9X2IU18_9MICO|nr:hypothetical protein [Rathayibacter rubneri]MCM6763123.1 hypothetical protein [Rathayibacter rubneri]